MKFIRVLITASCVGYAFFLAGKESWEAATFVVAVGWVLSEATYDFEDDE